MKEEIKYILKFAGFVFTNTFLIYGVLAFGITRMQFPGQLAAIEQLRHDNSPEVYRLVCEANQSIARYKAYRKTFFGFIIPPGWDHVQFLDIDKK